MKKFGSFILLAAMLLLAITVPASAGTVTANGNGFTDIPFSNGYRGFCLDEDLQGAYSGDTFSTGDTSLATSNDAQARDISQKLKVLFTQCFDDLFEADGSGSYDIDDNLVQAVIWNFTDNRYVSGVQKTLVNKTNNYSGSSIPDKGYKLTLDNGDTVTFDFMVMVPEKEQQQYFFAYRIKVAAPVNYSVKVTTDGNGAVTANPKEAEAGTKITLKVTPNDGYELDELWVRNNEVSSDVADGSYSFSMPESDVNVSASFKKLHVCGEGALVPGQEADCTVDGWKNYYRCSCGELFVDEKCTDKISNLDAWKNGAGKVEAGHNYGELIEKEEEVHTPSELKPGVEAHYYCDKCEKYFTETKEETTMDELTGETPEHSYGEWVNTDAEKHWKECECGLTSEEGEHVYDDAKDADCNTCGYERVIEHEHTFEETYTYDEKSHWYESTCGHDVVDGLEEHHGGSADCTEQAVCEDCGQSYGEPGEHNYGELIEKEEEVHTPSELKPGVEAHYYCDKCEKYFTEAKEETTMDELTGETPEHSYGEWVNTDAEKHWKECECGLTSEEGEHVYDDAKDADCNTCGYERVIPKYIVTFDANGGSGTMAPQTFYPDEMQSLTRSSFTRSKYKFDGWNTAADGSGKTFGDGAPMIVSSDMTLYAQWEKVVEINPIKIVTQPNDRYVAEGQSTKFSIKATGDGLKYQWSINRNDGKGWSELKGASDSVYVTSAADLDCDGFRYVCVVTDKYGNSEKSDVAVLHVSEESTLPQTGDESTPILWMAMCLMSLMGIALLGKKAYAK